MSRPDTPTVELVREGLARARYLTTPRVETVLYLTLCLEKPLLIEGPAGAGKTEIGKVLAETLRTDLVRLQCYEGLDEAKALYEWNYQKQLLRIQADRGNDLDWARSNAAASTSTWISPDWRLNVTSSH